MNRRSFFSLPLAILPAAKAVEAKPATYNPSYWREKVELALCRLGYLAPGNSASEVDYNFCAKFCDPWVTPEELTERLRPYYPDRRQIPHEPLAWTPPQNCAKCGGAIMALTRDLVSGLNLVGTPLMVLTCAGLDGNCANRWPWIQFPNGKTVPVSSRIRELFEEGERADTKLRTAEWNYHNRIDLGVSKRSRADALVALRYMTFASTEIRSLELYKEFAPWR